MLSIYLQDIFLSMMYMYMPAVLSLGNLEALRSSYMSQIWTFYIHGIYVRSIYNTG